MSKYVTDILQLYWIIGGTARQLRKIVPPSGTTKKSSSVKCNCNKSLFGRLPNVKISRSASTSLASHVDQRRAFSHSVESRSKAQIHDQFTIEEFAALVSSTGIEKPKKKNRQDLEQYVGMIESFLQSKNSTGANQALTDVLGTPGVRLRLEHLLGFLRLAEMNDEAGFMRRAFLLLIQRDVRQALIFYENHTSGILRTSERVTVKLLIASLREGLLEDALSIYKNAKSQDFLTRIPAYGQLISALCEAERWSDARAVYDDLAGSGTTQPDRLIFTDLVDGSVTARDFASFTFYHTQLVEKDVTPDLRLYTSLISGFFKFGRAKNALACFKEMTTRGILPDDVLYMVFLNAYSRPPLEDPGKVLQWYYAMTDSGFSPNKEVFTSILAMFARKGNIQAVESGWEELIRAKVVPDEALYTTVIAAYARLADQKNAQLWYNKMLAEGLKPDTYAYTALISAYSAANDFQSATAIRNEMRSLLNQEKSSNTMPASDPTLTPARVKMNAWQYNSTILHLLRERKLMEAQGCLQEMQELDISPDAATFVALVQSYGQERKHEGVLETYHAMINCGVVPTPFMYSELVKAFDRCQAGAEQFRALIKEMARQNIPPTSDTLVSLMFAFLGTGAPEDAMQVWKAIHADSSTASPDAGTFRLFPPEMQPDSSILESGRIFRPYMMACFESARRSPSKENEIIEDLIQAARSLIDQNVFLEARTWDRLLTELRLAGRATSASDLLCLFLDRLIHLLTTTVNHNLPESQQQSLKHISQNSYSLRAHYAPLDTSEPFRNLLFCTDAPKGVLLTRKTVLRAAQVVQPRMLLPLVNQLRKSGYQESLSRLQSTIERLRETHPNAVSEQLLNVFTPK
ncbi:hypothetical protein DFS34DRAFT_619452 [Phlyctochytrium arcticum]|nr:hypothetical protein DFS34DRAFT_619452 [Phlyctochytrium arcticum]